MSNPIADPGHGHSPAAWTAVIIMLVVIPIMVWNIRRANAEQGTR